MLMRETTLCRFPVKPDYHRSASDYNGINKLAGRSLGYAAPMAILANPVI
jgi:hypothetical protein